MTMVGIDIHNPREAEALADLIIRPSAFDRGRIALLLPKVEPAKGELRGVQRQPLSPDDPVGRWYVRGGKEPPKSLEKRWHGVDRTTLWSISSTQVALLGGLRMRPGETLHGILVLAHKRDVATPRAPRVTLEQRIGGVSVGGSTFQVGYDRGSSPSQLAVRRLRIVSDRLEVHHEREQMWVCATLADDPERAWLRPVPNGRHADEPSCLFDGYVAEGESLTLELLGHEGPRGRETLYRHRFAGPIDSWLTAYKADARGNGHLRLRYRVTDITPSQAEVAD
jgi:hypothetical protein